MNRLYDIYTIIICFLIITSIIEKFNEEYADEYEEYQRKLFEKEEVEYDR